MNSQKLGLVLGMNMAVACLVFQGCKVTRPGADNVPPPVVDPAPATVETTPVVEVQTAAPAPQVQTSTTIEVAPVVEPVVEQPSQVRTVGKLPQKPAEVSRPVAAPAPAEGGSTVVVQRGDTLSGICVRNHVKMSAVMAANPGLNPNRILVGQKLVIPGAVAASAAVPAEKPAKVMNAAAPAPANTTAPVKTKPAFKAYNGPTKEYKVRSGDSLGRIAYDSGITIRALKEMNKLTKDSLRVGQTILVPAAKVAPATSAATKAAPVAKAPEAKTSQKPSKPAESSVAEQKVSAAPESTTVAAAVEAAPAPVVEKAVVSAPAEAAPATAPVAEPAPAVEAAAEPVQSSSQTYTVKEGDDIVGVAIAWGISPSQLMDLNNLKAGESISVGQVLKLPANAKSNGQ